MRFLADMGVAREVVAWLREQGFDAWHLRERGLQRLPDHEIFSLAQAEGRVVLTFDLDFSEIAALSRSTTSVVLFRVSNGRAAAVIRHLERVLSESKLALEAGAIVTVEDRRIRVRPLPIGSVGRDSEEGS